MAKGKIPQRWRSIIELSCVEARAFLLKEESYSTISLPPYFQFNDVLSSVAKVLKRTNLSTLRNGSPRHYDGVNHLILDNKDGMYAWRPLELIHPALYVSLVNSITDHNNWLLIRNRFGVFGNDATIQCLSLPVKSLTKENDRAKLIGRWWKDVEQQSIELSLEYNFIIRTDVTDCYAAIYTHTIPWALHTKQIAKARRNDKNLIGNIIDGHIQDMRQGQTNGIPQGSVLMDFIAEIVLGYADTQLLYKITDHGISNYRILRYRDDYRIFVNSQQDGETILRCLAEVMIGLGLKLNPGKTDISSEVIRSSLKEDKLSWMFRKQADRDLQKRLLIIHNHSMKHINSGSLEVALIRYYKRLSRYNKYSRPLPLISIVIDIAYRNPRTYPIASAIVSKLLSFLETDNEKRSVIGKIVNKFSQIPNTGYLEIWLQRISGSIAPNTDFDELLCKLVSQGTGQPWNSNWIASHDLLQAINTNMVVDGKTFKELSPVVSIEEVELFESIY